MPPPRGPRVPACDACRQSKLSCDHGVPVCGRCMANGKQSCVYRSRPTARKKRNPTPRATSPSNVTETGGALAAPACSAYARGNYPNPGYLGASSHVTIFSQLSRDATPQETTGYPGQMSADLSYVSLLESDGELYTTKVAQCTRDLLQTFSLDLLKELVVFWRATGANLALAEPLVDLCPQILEELRMTHPEITLENCSISIRNLIRNSKRPLECAASLTFEQYVLQLLNPNPRLETLGLFFCAVVRATSEISTFPFLYTDHARRQKLLALSVRLTDAAVEAMLALDNLNDLQLVFQYENFISYSYAFGVQSYHSYRKLGDVVTSLVTLGYHEELGQTKDVAPFVLRMRKTAFARTYSADKNWAIFLGRPPRLCRSFCDLPLAIHPRSSSNEHIHQNNGQIDVLRWNSDTGMSIWAETRWSAICASFKEEILELFNSRDHNNLEIRVSDLQERAGQQWSSLPNAFRIEGSLKDCQESPWDRDFLVSTRLNYLHVLFLSRLLCLGARNEPDSAFVSVGKEILSLVVEALVQRSQLVCSTGTSFEWKLAHYGLPAIGIIMIAMLKTRTPEIEQDVKVLRDLGVVVTLVELGTVVCEAEPNYALLIKATDTIKRFLRSLHVRDRHPTTDATLTSGQQSPGIAVWDMQSQLEPWDFEINFWDHLAEHPYMFETS